MSVISSALFVVSCVDDNYNLKKLNTEITVVQNVTLPVGETEKITFQDLLETYPDIASNFQELEDGTYKAYYAGEEDFTNELPDFAEIAKIDATTFSTDFEYKFDGLDPDSFKIGRLSKRVDFDIIPETSVPLNSFDFVMDDVVAQIDLSPLSSYPGGSVPQSNPYTAKVLTDEACEVTCDKIVKPEIISSIDTIYFSSSKGIELNVSANNIPAGMNMSLKSVSIKFPKGIKAQGSDENGVVTFSNKTFPFSETVVLEYLLPANEDDSIYFNDNLLVNADVNIWGNAPSATGGQPTTINFSIGSGLEVVDIAAMTETGEYRIDVDPVKFTVDLPKETLDLGTMILKPKNTPQITLGIIIPETDIEVVPSDKGIKITIPQMLELTDIPSTCTYNKATRELTIKNTVPENLKFTIDYLKVTPHEVSDECLDEAGFAIDGSLMIKKSRMHKKDIDAYLSTKFATTMEMDEIQIGSISFDELSVKLDKTFSIPLIKAGTLSKEIVSIGEILFEETAFSLGAEFNNLPSVDEKNPITVNMELDLPDFVTPSKMTVNGEIKNGKLTVDPVTLEKIDLSGLDFSKDINLEVDAHVEILATKPTVNETTLANNISAVINGGLPQIKIGKVDANVDFSLTDLSKTISLVELFGNLGDKLNINLSLDNPYLLLDLSSNIGVPVDIRAEMISYKGGRALKTVSIDTRYDKAASVDEFSHMKVFIAKKDEGRTGDYKFIQADIPSLFSGQPDSVKVSLSAKTDKDEISTIIPGANYSLKAAYEVGTPLKLDENFLVSYKDTLNVDGFGYLLEHAAISLFGTVENKLPLQFEMEVTFLDENGKVVELSKPTKTLIASCNSDGSVAKSDFEFNLTAIDNQKAANIKLAVFAFNLTCGSASGVGIKSDSYIQASLKMKLPEGFTYDLKDLTNK